MIVSSVLSTIAAAEPHLDGVEGDRHLDDFIVVRNLFLLTLVSLAHGSVVSNYTSSGSVRNSVLMMWFLACDECELLPLIDHIPLVA